MMERDNYFGRILTGRIASGIVRVGDKVHGLRLNGSNGEVIEVGKVKITLEKKPDAWFKDSNGCFSYYGCALAFMGAILSFYFS